MRRSFEAYLWDEQDAAGAILKFTKGQTLQEYLSGDMLQAAVERKFEIIGEALTCARREFPDRAGEIPDVSTIISFRNQLAHNYNNIDSSRVWEIVEDFLPILVKKINAILAARRPKPQDEL